MKVILIKDVARVGRRAEVIDVPAGHAQNFLIPRGLAVPATDEHLRRLEAETKHKVMDAAARERSFREALEALKVRTVRYAADANDQGHLWSGVKADDIARALLSEGFNIEAGDIELPHPLKSLGVHEVALVRGSERGTVTLEIVKR